MQVAPRTALLSVVAGVGISIAANAIATGFGDADFLLRSDLLWTGGPYALIGFLAVFGLLGPVTFRAAWALETILLVLAWLTIAESTSSTAALVFGYPIFVAPVLITLLAIASTAWRTSCDWLRHRDDTPLSIR
jgi:hypothetical protein